MELEPAEDRRKSSSSEPRDQGPPRPLLLRTSCDTCKRMKIKCEKKDDSCVHCIERGLKCDTTLVERKKRAKGCSLAEMENRIKRLESVLTMSGIDAQSAYTETTSEKTENLPDLNDKLSALLIDKSGTSRFLGASSGLSLFSPEGLKWISQRTGCNDLSKVISRFSNPEERANRPNNAELWHTLSRSDREPLPPKELADEYIQGFFSTFNRVFPLFNRKIFDEYYEQQYSEQPSPTGTAWYAALNVVLCMGCISCGFKNQDRPQGPSDSFDDLHARKYFRNACGCLADLMFSDCNLMAIQAICGMSFVHQLTMDAQSVYTLSAAAGRMAYSIGLHQKLDGFGLRQEEIDQRRNVFWIVYIMDKAIALRVGLPSLIRDDDVGHDMPQDPVVIGTRPDGSKNFDLFRYQIEIGKLESNIYTELYSARSRSKTTMERFKSVDKLDSALEEWRISVELDIRPQEPIQCHEEQFMPVVMMHFAYYNCLTTIHRSSVYHGSWTHDTSTQNPKASEDLDRPPRVGISQSICVATARSSIELLQEFDFRPLPNRGNMTWMVLYYAVSGLLTLVTNMLQNPRNASVSSDLKLMDFVISRISFVALEDRPFPFHFPINVFIKLGFITRNFVEKTNSGTKNETDHSHDDFVPSKRKKMLNTEGREVIDFSERPVANMKTQNSTAPTANSSAGLLSAGNSLSPSFPQNMPQQVLHGQHPLEQIPTTFGSEFSAFPDGAMLSDWDCNTIPEAPIFTGHFEWDLANLWNYDFNGSPGI